MESPQCFISLNGPIGDPNSKLVADQGVCRLLADLPAPIGVISVAGLYRTGKSFILNQLAGSKSGFDIGSSVEPQTQGIWCWIVQKEKLREHGIRDDMSVVLLDTEGLGSYTKTEAHDMKIFALAILLSSFLVYNSLGTIDDTAVDNISLLVELTKNIKATSDNKQSQDPYEAAMFFPKFLWLLRDFSLDLVMDGKKVSPQQYLENALKPLDESHPDADSKNRVRDCLRKFFPDKSCFTLKRPVLDEEQLHELHTLPLEQFRPEYLEEVHNLIVHIYGRLTAKTMFGSPLSGAMFVHLAQSYIDGLNSSGMPVIQNAWESVVEIQSREAVNMAIKGYKAAMDAAIGEGETQILEQTEFNQAHETALAQAIHVFRQMAVGNSLSSQSYEQEVRTEANKLRDVADERNATRSRTTCTLMLEKLMAGLMEKTRGKQITSFDALLEAYRQIHGTYQQEAMGPYKHAAVFNLDQAAWLEPARELTINLVNTAESRVSGNFTLELEKAKHEYTVLQELYQSVDMVYKKEEETAKKLRSENTDLRYEAMAAQRKLKENEKEISEQRDKIGELEKRCTKTEAELKESQNLYNEEIKANEARKQLREKELQENVVEIARLQTVIDERLKEKAVVEKDGGCNCVIM